MDTRDYIRRMEAWDASADLLCNVCGTRLVLNTRTKGPSLLCPNAAPLSPRHRPHRVAPLAGRGETDQETRARRLAPGAPNRRAWERAYRSESGRMCHYCRQTFTDALPPTVEHIKPRSMGGSRSHSVLVCQPCNNRRGVAPFVAYMAAVERAHDEAARTGRSFQRPRGHKLAL